MVYIIYKVEYSSSSVHEQEAGFAYSLTEACKKAYATIMSDPAPINDTRYKYYIREYNQPVKPMSCPISFYTFDAHHNCICDKKIVWSP